ncbi:unnamed protein product [Lota lota]
MVHFGSDQARRQALKWKVEQTAVDQRLTAVEIWVTEQNNAVKSFPSVPCSILSIAGALGYTGRDRSNGLGGERRAADENPVELSR